MRIAIDARTAENKSGIGVATESLIRSLLKIDNKNEYLIIGNRRPDWLPNTVEFYRTRFKLVHHPWVDLWNYIYLPLWLIKKDVALFWGAGYFIPFIPCKIKKIATFHDLSPIACSQFFPFKTLCLLRVTMAISIRTANKIMTISTYSHQEIHRIYGARISARTCVVPMAADQRFQASLKNKELEYVRLKYGLPNDYILYVGNIEPRKNITTLAKAFQQFVSNGYPGNLVIVGQKAWLSDESLRMLQQGVCSKRVLLTGYVPDEDLPAIYQNAKVFAYPSLYEGFGMPILEAMMSGVPVVASNRASLPEVGGNAAVLVEPLDVHAWVSALHKLMIDPFQREKYNQLGKERVLQFSWEASAFKLKQIFEACG